MEIRLKSFRGGTWVFRDSPREERTIMPTTYYLISSYVQDTGGLNLVIDFKGGSASPASGTLLVTNQPTGADSQLWTIVPDGASGYSFIQSKVKDPKGKHLVIDIDGGVNTPGTLLDGFPRKSSGYDNQLWKFVAEVLVPGYSFIESKLKNPKGKHLVIDIKGGSNTLGTKLDAYTKKSTGYDNQLWQLVPV
jgi:hypothetical protein